MFITRGELHDVACDATAQRQLRLFLGAAAIDRDHGVEQPDEAQHRRGRGEVRSAGQAGGL